MLRTHSIIHALLGAALGLALPAQTAAQTAHPEPRYDVTANGALDASDVAAAAGAWSDVASASQCAAGIAADVDGDGCLTAADVQRIAARIAPAPAAKDSGSFTWTVTSDGDAPDAVPGDGQCRTGGGQCTLRAAIDEANRSAGSDTITFDIRGGGGSCPALVTITPDSAGRGMLMLDDPRGDGTVIDGYTQCGARPNSGATEGDADIRIEIRGGFDRNVHGLRLLSPNNIVRGLALYSWDRQIEVMGGRARGNRIEGSFLGTNAAQTFSSGGLGTHHSEGLRIQLGASNTIVGCGAFDAAGEFQPCANPARAYAARNIIAGNGDDGIHLERQVTGTRIVGNYIGLRQDGATIQRNRADGVDFEQGPQHNWLGGQTPLERNVISGNGSDGIEISHGTGTQFNHVAGNYFGLDASGARAAPNGGNGISFEDTVDQNAAHGNVVSGNNQSGFRFYVLATRNEVRGNLVGLAADGATPLPNRHNGVYVMGGSQHNRIVENVIAHNRDHGVFLASTSDADHDYIGETFFNTVSRNRMFANGRAGITLFGKRDITPNEGLAAPALGRAGTRRVEGSACPGCRVEVFLADKTTLRPSDGDDAGEGMLLIGEGTADGAGRFTIDIQPMALGQILTASATDVRGNTSPFARNVAVADVTIVDPTPAPTLTPPPLPVPTPGPEPALDQAVWLPLIDR